MSLRRNLLLISAVVISFVLVINSTKKILSFRTTSTRVAEAEQRLQRLREENEKLKSELAYKNTEEFKEAEIRNKLGLAKEGETVVVVPKENDARGPEATKYIRPNWQKWRDLFFGS